MIYEMCHKMGYFPQNLKKWPMKMGEEIIEHSMLEKYLGDITHEKGCKETITATFL